jgi:transcriptional regulator with XRE-family HTH domain
MKKPRSGGKLGVARKRREKPRSAEAGPGVLGRTEYAKLQRALLGERIRRQRESQGMAQVELARRVGRSERTIRVWETGRCPISGFEQVGAALGIPVRVLVGSGSVRIDSVEAGEPFAISLERQVMNELRRRGRVEDFASVALPRAQTIAALVVEVIADDAERRLRGLASVAVGSDDTMRLIDALRARLGAVDPMEDRARFAPEDARTYQTLWHLERGGRGRAVRRSEKVVLKGVDEMSDAELAATATTILKRLPRGHAVDVALAALSRDKRSRALLRGALSANHQREVLAAPAVAVE